jgi:CheY-like chemotaxis protein
MSHYHILLVEDQAMNAQLVKIALSSLDVEIRVAESGAMALHLYENGTAWDLILMDLHLSDTNGFAVTDTIRQSARYKSLPIPIIALTANALMEDKATFLKTNGFADYLTKPLRKEIFLAAICKHLPTLSQSA